MERYLRKLAVMSTLLAVVGLAQAQGDEDLCAEFKDGVVVVGFLH